MGEEPRKPRRRPPRQATPESLANVALHYLGRFASSAANLRRILRRRVDRWARAQGTDPGDGYALIEALVGRYESAGLLDDRAYAEARVRSLRSRGGSARLIRLKLVHKGVGRDDIDRALAGLEDHQSEHAAAAVFARRRRIGPFRAGGRRAARERDLALLSRAGFSYDVARRVVDAASAEDLEAEAD